MNKKLVIAAAVASIAASSSALALNKQGLYVSGSAGISKADDGDAAKNLVSKFPSYEWKRGGFGWGAAAGWVFNRNFAIEAGYLQFAKNTYKALEENFQHKTSAWNLVGKAALPIADSNWDVYAKAGLAYQITKYSGAKSMVGNQADADRAFRPTAGVGVGYNFDNGFGVDLSWSRIFGRSDTSFNTPKNLHLAQPNSDMFALSITYNIQTWA